ncbi:MAG: hypothetical protein LBK98_08110 [Peptococcaceae bacterium]|jgi:hypothetical protein|nr:hypothetical protein [Peptococcaceae bacterium]
MKTLKLFSGKKALGLTLVLLLALSSFAMTALAVADDPIGQYTQTYYFYSTSTGLPANHGDNLVNSYTVNNNGTVTLFLQEGLIVPPYGPSVLTYFDEISVLNADGEKVTILTPEEVEADGSSEATIPDDAVSGQILFTFHVDGTPEEHTQTVYLELVNLPAA